MKKMIPDVWLLRMGSSRVESAHGLLQEMATFVTTCSMQ